MAVPGTARENLPSRSVIVPIEASLTTLILAPITGSPLCLISLAQSRTVSGVVLDSRGDPVIGANIRVVSDASIGTITDLDGKFSLAVPGTAKQLEISFIGMQTQTVSIVAGQPVHVTLAEDAEILDEVVVIGYQTVKRKDLTGSVASVSGEQIAAMPVANAAQALQGKASVTPSTASTSCRSASFKGFPFDITSYSVFSEWI